MTQMPSPEGATPETNQGRSMLVQWFPQWWGWYKTDSPTSHPPSVSIDSPQPSQLAIISTVQGPSEPTIPKDQNQLEDEILNALAGSVENNSLLKRDAVFGKFTFTLNKGTLDVCNGVPEAQSRLMLQLQFENLLLDIESRPRSGSHFVGLSLGSVFVKDHITNNADFPDLIRPQCKDEILATHARLNRPVAKTQRNNSSTSSHSDPLFEMSYERKPLSFNTDYRLQIKSQSLDVVYNREAIKWILDFVMKPHQIQSTRRRIEAMKNKTKLEFIKNWENILEGDLSERKTWTLEIDISAPQIIFAENFQNKNSSIMVIDFGRLQVTNSDFLATDPVNSAEAASDAMLMRRDSEDEEAFMTPCSTPPGSEASTTDSPTLCSALSEIPDFVVNLGDTALNERTIHNKLYDSYSLNLTDLQVLVCKAKERWAFASTKGSSPLHVLDRFSILLQIERRVVYTQDPQYPSLTVSGSLPKLVAHVNESKIAAITQIVHSLSTSNIQSPQKSSPSTVVADVVDSISGSGSQVDDDEEQIADSRNVSEDINQPRELSKSIMLQFVVDQMALEVQSRGRSIAELQVTGVRAGYTQRIEDTSLTLSVHGLLLVDAIQSFGPDFELLVASHRHVG